MDDVESLTHTLWECKYHVVWIPKYRKKVMFCKLREQMGTLLKDLAMQKGCKAVAHGVLSIFGTYSVNETDKVLMLQVERSSFPNQTGENLKRVITSLTADELIYTIPKRLAGGSNTFVWKRAK